MHVENSSIDLSFLWIVGHTSFESYQLEMNNTIALVPCAPLFLLFSLSLSRLDVFDSSKKCVTGTVCYFVENQIYSQVKFASIHVRRKKKKRKRIAIRCRSTVLSFSSLFHRNRKKEKETKKVHR